MAEMHFLHLRLAKNSFQWWENTDDLKAAQEEVTKLLKEEGWHHTPSLSINPRAHSMGGAAAILAPANESRFKVSVPIVARAPLYTIFCHSIDRYQPRI